MTADAVAPVRVAIRAATPLARLLVGLDDLATGLRRRLGWALDLTLRLWVAQSFLMAAVMRMMGGTAPPPGAADVLPTFLQSLTFDRLGAVVEALAPLALAAGLLTRLSALALLVLAVGALAAGMAADTQARAVVLLWYVLAGAGAASVDALIRRGLGRAALPFVERGRQAARGLARFGLPPFLLLARLWAAAATLAFALMQGGALATAALALPGAALALGLGASAAALVLACLPFLAGGMAKVVGGYPTAALALLVLAGPGPWSPGRPVVRWARARLAGTARPHGPEVVIVGGGFAGIAAALELRRAPCRVTLVDRRNHHLFQPLLYQVATGALSPADVATPIRELFRDHANTRVLLAQCVGVDQATREVVTETGRIRYDHLLLATGSRTGYLGHEEWAGVATGLKDIDDATEIRRRLLVAFEWAEAATDPVTRARCLTFVVIGGGPTGVELAGAIAELARFGLVGDFRSIEPAEARVILLQSPERILPAFPAELSEAAAASLRALGVEIRTKTRVEHVDEQGVVIAGERLPAVTVFWAAGVTASPVAAWLGVEAVDRGGRVAVLPDLSLPGRPEIFVAGDVAASDAWAGQPVPGLAAGAKQMGHYIGRVLRTRVEGRRAPPPFRYRHLGSLATIGRDAAVADFGRVRLDGALAWWLWGGVHLLLLNGVRNRLSVALDWLWAYFTYRQGTLLITGRDPALWRGPRPAGAPKAESPPATMAPAIRAEAA